LDDAHSRAPGDEARDQATQWQRLRGFVFAASERRESIAGLQAPQ